MTQEEVISILEHAKNAYKEFSSFRKAFDIAIASLQELQITNRRAEVFIDFLKRLDVIEVQPNEAVFFRFPAELYDPETAEIIHNNLMKKFPNNSVVTFVDDASLEIMSRKELLEAAEKIRQVAEDME